MLKAKITRDFPTCLPGATRNVTIPPGSVVEGETAAAAIDNGYGEECSEDSDTTDPKSYKPLKLSPGGRPPAKKVSGPRSSAGEGPRQQAAKAAALEKAAEDADAADGERQAGTAEDAGEAEQKPQRTGRGKGK